SSRTAARLSTRFEAASGTTIRAPSGVLSRRRLASRPPNTATPTDSGARPTRRRRQWARVADSAPYSADTPLAERRPDPVTSPRRMANSTPGRRPDWVSDELFPFASRFADVDGHNLHFVDEGSGPVLLLYHGNPTWSFLYRDIISELST